MSARSVARWMSVLVCVLCRAGLCEEPQDAKALVAENRLLKAQVEAQREQIEALKKQVASLEAKLNGLPAAQQAGGSPATTRSATSGVDALPVLQKTIAQVQRIRHSNATELQKDTQIKQAYSDATKLLQGGGILRAKVMQVAPFGAAGGPQQIYILNYKFDEHKVAVIYLSSLAKWPNSTTECGPPPLAVEIPQAEAALLKRGDDVTISGTMYFGFKPSTVTVVDLGYEGRYGGSVYEVYSDQCSLTVHGKTYVVLPTGR